MIASQESIEVVRERLTRAIARYRKSYLKRYCLWTIERIIRKRPAVLTAVDGNYRTPLHAACREDAPLEVIQILLHYGREAAQMIDFRGNMPLHRACQNSKSPCIESISILVEAHPEALTKSNSDGRTPILLACGFHRDSSAILLLLLDRCPPRALGMRSISGKTPLHVACLSGMPIDIIRQMIRMYPKALRMLSNGGDTPLQIACCVTNASVELVKLLVAQCPESCLFLDNSNKSPYDYYAAQRQRSVAIQEFLLEATKDASLALLECVFCYTDVTTIPPDVVAHMKSDVSNVVPDLNEDSFRNMSVRRLVESIKPHLDQETLRILLRNRGWQSLLQYEDYRDLIRGVYHMNKLVHDVGNKVQGVRVLETVSDTPACMFLHLRKNPSLCQRER
jgi:ankyrin repeat protein